MPWLEADVADHLRALASDGVRRVVLVPIGFVADRMELVFDLETEAREVADGLVFAMTRAACAGSAPHVVAGLRDLVVAHMEGRPPESIAPRGPRVSPCAPDCCAYTPRRG